MCKTTLCTVTQAPPRGQLEQARVPGANLEGPAQMPDREKHTGGGQWMEQHLGVSQNIIRAEEPTKGWE